jgi:hypothetical protein
MKQEHVEGKIPFAVGNSINTTNTMNPINSIQGPGFEGSSEKNTLM